MGFALDLAEHLYRLTAWSLASLAAGILFLFRDRRSGFGTMTAGWALVNYVIVLASLRAPVPTDYEAFRRFLVFNLGLNVVWLLIGFVMMRKRNHVWVSRAGLAVVQQAAVLQFLDLILYWQTSR